MEEGNNLLSARYTYEGTGTQTAAVTFGGSPAPLSITEEYDGTSWTESGDMELEDILLQVELKQQLLELVVIQVVTDLR